MVVAEFENLTGDPALAFLGITAVDWFTEGIQRTGLVSGVATETAVRASRFVRTTTGTEIDPILLIAREASAKIVVTGRFYRTRDSVQYQIQVHDVQPKRLVGAIGPFSSPLTDPIAGLAEASTRLMGLLATDVDRRLEQFVRQPLHPPTFDSYRDFSLGLDRYIASDFVAAATLFRGAFDGDTSFAAPAIFGSISLSNQGRYGEADSLLQRLSSQRSRLSSFHRAWLDFRLALLAGNRPAALRAVRALDEAEPRSKSAYNHALEALENGFVDEAITVLKNLSPDEGPMRGWIPYFEVLGAAHHLVQELTQELAIGNEARRRYPDRLYALLPTVRALAALGRNTELETLLQGARRLPPDPYGTTIAHLLVEAGDELAAHGNRDRAVAFHRRAVAELASAGGLAKQPQLMLLARAHRSLGDWTGLASTGRSLLELDTVAPDARGVLGVGLARLGRVTEARALIDSLGEDRRPYLFGGPALNQARIAAALGQPAEAISYLQRAIAQGREYDLWIHRDHDFAALRADSGFVGFATPRR